MDVSTATPTGRRLAKLDDIGAVRPSDRTAATRPTSLLFVCPARDRRGDCGGLLGRGTATMTEGQSLAAREAVREVLASQHADVLRESVALMVREIMELEVSQLAGAELGERAPERRNTQRNGYRERRWDPRVGEIELRIPKLRTGSYLPSFLEPRRRAEQALVAVVHEAYVNGVSTRKVDRLVEQMGLRGLSQGSGIADGPERPNDDHQLHHETRLDSIGTLL